LAETRGGGVYRKKCYKCRIPNYVKSYKRGYYKFKKERELICMTCGFKAEHECQIDVDHIDGNHKNNAVGNLQLLCANCHRLKTYINKDYSKINIQS
jgi:hypothetical protein